MSAVGGLALFALDTSRSYGEGVAAALEMPLGAHEERAFDDDEHKARPLADVRGRDVYVVHSLFGAAGRSPNDKLCRLLFFIGALKDAGAGRVTAVTPYLCYARKDQRTQPGDPITTKYVARLFEAVGTDAVMVLDVHNLAAFENAFRCRTHHVEAIPLFVDHFAACLHDQAVAVVSPDLGGAKRAERFRHALAARLRRPPTAGFVDKHRSGGMVTGETLVGDVRERSVILLDDLISTGTTLERAARACRSAGAVAVFAAATHGLLIGHATERLAAPLFDGVAITDTVATAAVMDRHGPQGLTVLPSAPLVADAIAAAHASG